MKIQIRRIDKHAALTVGVHGIAIANNIGTPGMMGFGVGICPPDKLPPGFTGLPGYSVKGDPNYGNYQYEDGSIMVWIPKFYYRIHINKAITAATQANPCVITSVAHGLVTGDKAFICNVGGMTQINKLFFTVTRVDDNNFSLDGINSTAYGAYTSGGQFIKGVNAAYDFNPTLIGYDLNAIDIKSTDVFATTAAANAMGYALHRVFIDGGVEKDGFFVDKYKIGKRAKGTGFVGASVKNGNPISTASTHNPISGLSAVSGGNIYASMLEAAKGRTGVNGAYDSSSIFFCCSRFIHAALAMLSLAHAQASQTDTFCAWYHATNNFPKGCNNNALKDVNDTLVTYAGDGFQNCGKTGSGIPFAKTTHNGQDCGVSDLNGLVYEISIGATCIAAGKSITAATQANPCQITIANHDYSTGDIIMIIGVGGMVEINDKLFKVTVVDANNFTLNGVNSTAYTAYTSGGTCTKGTFYVAKQATAMKNFTSGAASATDHWGATGVAAMMDALSPETVASMFKVTGGGAFGQRYGSGANQVLGEALSGEEWVKTGLGAVKSEGSIDPSGIVLFGQDYYYQYIRDQLCLLACANWDSGAYAGVWSVGWSNARTSSDNAVGGRFACYPV